jgi:hypothetical protein
MKASKRYDRPKNISALLLIVKLAFAAQFGKTSNEYKDSLWY